MKRNHMRLLALCLTASMAAAPLGYVKAYASEETELTEIVPVETSAEQLVSETPISETAEESAEETSKEAAPTEEKNETKPTSTVKQSAAKEIAAKATAPTVSGNTVKIVKENGDVFAMFKISKSEVKESGSKLQVTITSSTSYDQLYLGSKEDADKTPVISKQDDGTFVFEVNASDKGKVLPVVPGKSSGSWYSKADLWIYIPAETTTETPEPDPEPTPTPTPDPTPTVPADGNYEVPVTSDSGMFKITACRLEVKGGKMNAVLTLSGTGYDYLYAGSAAEAAAAEESSWIAHETDEEGKYVFTLPLSSAEKTVKIAARSQKKGTWYDRTLTFDYDKMEVAQPVVEDGVYAIDVKCAESMFSVKSCTLTVKDGRKTALLTLGGTGYDYLYAGTGAAAVEAGEEAWIPYVEDKDGAYTFTVPVEKLDTEVTIAAHSKKKLTWYDRHLTFQSETMKKISEEGTTKPSNPGTTPGTPTVKPNDGKADSESKWESDTSGSTSKVNNSTTLADGVYTPDRFTWSGGSGRVQIYCNKITISGGQAYATLVFDSDSYQYVKANGNVYYASKGAGTASVVVPVALNQNNRILAMTTKMSAMHEIAYTIFVYLAEAGNGQSAGAVQNHKLDDKAPDIMGLEYQSETELEYAEYFKIYHYDQGITLLEIDVTKDTARDPEKQDADQKKEDTKETEEISEEDQMAADSAEEGEAVVSEAEQAAELYKGNVMKYLLVPEDAEIPVGLSEDMIVVQMPAEKAYVSTEAIREKLDSLKLQDLVAALGYEEETESEDVIYGGEETDLEYRDLVKQEIDLAILSEAILPNENEDQKDKKEEKLTLEEQTERWEEITEKFALLGIPVIIDRSEDEEEDLAKAEWIKVYGVLFGCEEQAQKLFDTAVKEAGETK